MSRPFSNSKTRIPNLERQNREKRDKTYVNEEDLLDIKSKIESTTVSENVQADLAYNRAVNNYDGVKDGQIKEFNELNDDITNNKNPLLIKKIENSYNENYFELAKNMIESSNMNLEQKRDAHHLLSIVDERVKNKIYSKKIAKLNDANKTPVTLPNTLPSVDQDAIRLNPDYNSTTLYDTVVITPKTEALLLTLDSLPVNYRESEYENSDIGAFILQIKLRADNMSIDLYISSTLLKEKKYGAAIVAESAYNFDNSILICVYKEIDSNKLIFTLKNVEDEKKRSILTINASYNILLGGNFTLPSEIREDFVPTDKHKRIGDGVVKGNETGVFGPINNVMSERTFFNLVQQHIAISDSITFGDSYAVRINSIDKEIENADVNMVHAQIREITDLRKAIYKDAIVLSPENERIFVDTEQDGRFIENEPYKTYYDKVSRQLYIGSNWGLYVHNFETNSTRIINEVKGSVYKIKYDLLDDKLKIGTSEGFWECSYVGTDREVYEKKELDFYILSHNDEKTFTQSTSILDPERSNLPSMKTCTNIYENNKYIYSKAQNYEVKDFMHVYTDIQIPKFEEVPSCKLPNLKELVEIPEETAANMMEFDIDKITLIDNFVTGRRRELNQVSGGADWYHLYDTKRVEITTLKNSSDFLIRVNNEKEYRRIPKLISDENCTYEHWCSGLGDFEDHGAIAVIVNKTRLFYTLDLENWREKELKGYFRDNGDIIDLKFVWGFANTGSDDVGPAKPNTGVWMLLFDTESTKDPDNKTDLGICWISEHRILILNPNFTHVRPNNEASRGTVQIPYDKKLTKILNINQFNTVALYGSGTDNSYYNHVVLLGEGNFTDESFESYEVYCSNPNSCDFLAQKTNGPHYFKHECLEGKTLKLRDIVVQQSQPFGFYLMHNKRNIYHHFGDICVDRFFVLEVEDEEGNVDYLINDMHWNGGNFKRSDLTIMNKALPIRTMLREPLSERPEGLEEGVEVHNEIVGTYVFDEKITGKNYRFFCIIFNKNNIQLEHYIFALAPMDYNDTQIPVSHNHELVSKIFNDTIDIVPITMPSESEYDIDAKNSIFLYENGSYNEYIIQRKIVRLKDTILQEGDFLRDLEVKAVDGRFLYKMSILERGETLKTRYFENAQRTDLKILSNTESEEGVCEMEVFHVKTHKQLTHQTNSSDYRTYTVLPKTFVLRNEKIYKKDEHGGKTGDPIMENSHLIGGSSGFDLIIARNNVNMDGDLEQIKFMKEVLLTPYEIPLEKANDTFHSNSGTMVLNTVNNNFYDPEIDGLRTDNIAFIPYKDSDGKRCFMICIGLARRSSFETQRFYKPYIEQGQVILHNFNSTNYIKDKALFDVVLEDELPFLDKGLMNIKNTAVGMCPAYTDYNPENMYVIDRKSQFVQLYAEEDGVYKFKGKKYLRGDRSVLTNLVHFPQLNGYIFGDNYQNFYTDEDIPNRKTMLHLEDHLGEQNEGKVFINIQELDGSYKIIAIDNKSNAMWELTHYESYNQFNQTWENITFPEIYNPQFDRQGRTLYKMLEETGMPYDTPCKASGYIILNGMKFMIAQVKIGKPTQEFYRVHGKSSNIEPIEKIGYIEMLFDPNSKFIHSYNGVNISAFKANPLNQSLGDQLLTDSRSVGCFPGVSFGADHILDHSNNELLYDHGIMNAWLDRNHMPVGGQPVRPDWTKSFQYVEVDSDYSNRTDGVWGIHAPIVTNKGTLLIAASDGVYRMDEELKLKKYARGVHMNPYTLYNAEGSIFGPRTSYYDKDANIAYFMSYDINNKSNVGLCYTTDDGFTYNFITTNRAILPSGFIKVDDYIYFVTRAGAIYQYKLNGAITKVNNRSYTLEKNDYVNSGELDKHIEIINKRKTLHRDDYKETLFREWEDPTSVYTHSLDNTTPENLKKLMDHDETGCMEDHGQTSLVRMTPWGQTNEQGINNRIRIAYKGPRFEVVTLGNEDPEGEPKQAVLEYSVFDIYAREWFEAVDGYENYSGIYINDELKQELPYNHGFDTKYVLNAYDYISNNKSYRNNNVPNVIIITRSKPSNEYYLSLDSGESFVLKEAPYPIKDILFTSNGTGVIMIPEIKASEKETSLTTMYISTDYGVSFEYRIDVENPYDYNGLLYTVNNNRYVLFKNIKDNMYIFMDKSDEEDIIVEERALPLKIKPTDIYNISETPTVVVMDSENSSGNLVKLLVSDNNCETFTVNINDSEKDNLVNIKSLIIDEDETTKRRILSWNKKYNEVKVILMPVEYSNLSLEYVGSYQIPQGPYANNSSATALPSSKFRWHNYYYDEELQKWIFLSCYDNGTFDMLIFDTPDLMSAQNSDIRYFRYNAPSCTYNISTYIRMYYDNVFDKFFLFPVWIGGATQVTILNRDYSLAKSAQTAGVRLIDMYRDPYSGWLCGMRENYYDQGGDANVPIVAYFTTKEQVDFNDPKSPHYLNMTVNWGSLLGLGAIRPSGERVWDGINSVVTHVPKNGGTHNRIIMFCARGNVWVFDRLKKDVDLLNLERKNSNSTNTSADLNYVRNHAVNNSYQKFITTQGVDITIMFSKNRSRQKPTGFRS